MWITPRPFSKFSEADYSILEENQFMHLMAKKSSILGTLFASGEEFIIGIKNGWLLLHLCSLSENKSVISISSSKDLAYENWNWVNIEVLSTLSKDPQK